MRQLSPTELSVAKQKFHIQRWTAIHKRKIEFEMTFEEWIDIWLSSGHWDERGRLGHQYVMSRKGDSGPYSVDNVLIQTHNQNAHDARGIGRPPRTKEHLEKISAARKGQPSHWKGKKVSQERIDKYIETRKRNKCAD